MKKPILRTCVITKNQYKKEDLIRIVRTPSSEVIIDKTGKANGRGAYLLLDLAVINKAIKSNVLQKKLEVIIPQSIYDELLSLCKQEI